MKAALHQNKLLWSLVSATIFAIALPAMLFGASELYLRFQKDINQTAQNDAEQIFNVLLRSASEAVWTYNNDSIDQLIEGISNDAAVEQIYIEDSFGEPFAKFDRGGEPPEHFISLAGAITYEGEVIGHLAFTYSLEEIYQESRSEALRLLAILALQAVCTLLAIVFVIKRQVTNPINTLIQSAKGISEGNLDTSVVLNRHDELGALSMQLDDARAALKDLLQNLEARVAERTEALSSVNSELEQTVTRLQRAQDDLVETEKLSALGALVAGVSHELNTPLGNSLMMSSTLTDTIKQFSDKLESGQITRSELSHYLQTIRNSADIMQSNITSAADLVRSFKQVSVDRTSEQSRQFELAEYLHEIEATLRHLFKHRPVQLLIKAEPPIIMHSYPGPLNQVINNLVNNALTHAFSNEEAGQVVIAAKVVDEEQVELTVRDNGAGIEPDNLARVFEPFFTTRLGQGGSGLGMHIVHNIVTSVLLGSLKVESEVGHGTLVRLQLPRDAIKKGDA